MQSIIQNIILSAKKEMLTPANLGVLKKGAKDNIDEILEGINFNQLVDLGSREKYDQWFDKEVKKIHKKILPLYRSNLDVTEENPYSYSARLLSHYIRYLSFQTWFCGHDGERFIQIQHPIISPTFLKTFPKLEISKANQIESKEDYYKIIEYYRFLIDQDLCEENKPLLNLIFGEEV